MPDNHNNQHGLSRYIPADVKLEVRRRSKNGCVVCRGMVYDYEHIDPEFADAKEHNPDNICLLCPHHHGEVTRGRLSKAQVRSAYDTVRQADNVRSPHYVAALTGNLTMGMGDASFSYIPSNATLIEYDGQKVFSVTYIADEVFGGYRPSINGSLYDISERELICLQDNEITLINPDVDVKFEGKSIEIRNADDEICLKITFDPPSGFKIDRLRMKYRDIICEMDQGFGVTVPILIGGHARFLVSGIEVKGASSAISYSSDRNLWKEKSIRMVGGKGILLPACGAVIAKDAGSMLLPRFEVYRLEGTAG